MRVRHLEDFKSRVQAHLDAGTVPMQEWRDLASALIG